MTWTISLHTSDPDESNLAASETTYKGYRSVNCPDSIWSPAKSGQVFNQQAISFPESKSISAPLPITHVAITRCGIYIAKSSLFSCLSPSENVTPCFGAFALSMSEDLLLDTPPSVRAPSRYPSECPCGIAARDCTYHR